MHQHQLGTLQKVSWVSATDLSTDPVPEFELGFTENVELPAVPGW